MSASRSIPPSGQQLAQQSMYSPLHGSKVGWVTGFEPGHGLLVDYQGNPNGPRIARSTVPMDLKTIEQAVALRQQVVLLFEEGNPALPLLVGFVQPVNETPLLDTLLGPPDIALKEAAIDSGQRIVIQDKDEVVLSCGKASITLRRNGRIIIRGTYIEAHSEGIHRIKGSSIQFN